VEGAADYAQTCVKSANAKSVGPRQGDGWTQEMDRLPGLDTSSRVGPATDYRWLDGV